MHSRSYRGLRWTSATAKPLPVASVVDGYSFSLVQIDDDRVRVFDAEAVACIRHELAEIDAKTGASP